jgi:putative transposase
MAVGVAHHVTQRGNGRRFLLDSDTDRRIYLELLQENLRLHDVLLVGHCLMSNHVHLIVIPGGLTICVGRIKDHPPLPCVRERLPE